MRLLRLFAVLPAIALLHLPARSDEKAGPNDNMPPEGFTALFNGKDLAGWQGHITMQERGQWGEKRLKEIGDDRNKTMSETWSVKDGVIHHVPKITKDAKGVERKSGVSLQTTKDYADAEFMVDWKIEKGGDSGLYVRGNPQIQIWDSDNLGSNPVLIPDKGTGSGGLWNNPLPAELKGEKDTAVLVKAGQKIGKVPLKRADKPVGEWNTFHIVSKGDKITIKLNGELVIDNAALPNYWDKGKPLPATGPFELQYHGDNLWFKNVYVKELK